MNKHQVKISNVNDYNNFVRSNYLDQILLFDKSYGYVLYGYNFLNVKNDFAYWYKTKKQAKKILESHEAS
jgi:hypothetical protein